MQCKKPCPLYPNSDRTSGFPHKAMSAFPRNRTFITSLSRPLALQLSHAPGVNQPLRFFNRFVPVEAIELERNQIKRLILACRFDLAAIGFGNYRPPRSIGSLEGTDSEAFVVRSAVSIAWHDAMYRRDRVARNACLASRLKPRLRYYRSLSAFPPLRQAKGPKTDINDISVCATTAGERRVSLRTCVLWLCRRSTGSDYKSRDSLPK